MNINRTCPYCGSNNIITEIAIKITGTLLEDGTVEPKDYWTHDKLKETITETSSQNMDGFCKDCGRYFPFSWQKGFFGNEDNSMLYLVEYGKLLPKEHKNYNKYNIVYDRKRAYYDFKQYFTLYPLDEIVKFKEKYKIDEKTNNYYIIITEQARLNQLPEDFNINEKPSGCNYSPIRIVYYEGIENGKPFYITNAPVNNALANRKLKKEQTQINQEQQETKAETITKEKEEKTDTTEIKNN